LRTDGRGGYQFSTPAGRRSASDARNLLARCTDARAVPDLLTARRDPPRPFLIDYTLESDAEIVTATRAAIAAVQAKAAVNGK
jgi:hypothetical protein